QQFMKNEEVVIIGAGPYGLSAAAHLRHAGVEPYVIGASMAFWKRSMPGGMLLRSRVEASNIHAPQRSLSIFGYEKAIGRKRPEPLPIEDFIACGDWLQKQVAPALDTRRVRNVAQNGSGFIVSFEDGEALHAGSVILALGIGPFVHRPE